jgi:hypothetical protein
MHRSSCVEHGFLAAVCGASVLLRTTVGEGADRPKKPNACTAAYESANSSEASAHLREAKRLLLLCAKPACGDLLLRECTTRYTQLDSDIPTVVPLATDRAGSPRVDVQVTMDGELLASRLDGKALPVDPGMHAFSFSSGDELLATQEVMIVQGQRNRPLLLAIGATQSRVALGERVGVSEKASLGEKVGTSEKVATNVPANEKVAMKESTLPPDGSTLAQAPSSETPREPEAVPDERSSDGRSAVPYVLGGVGVVSIATGALMISWGKKDNSALSQCSPNCLPSSVDHVRTMYAAGDVAVGVGVVALGVGVWRFMASSASTTKRSGVRATPVLDVQSSRSGAVATFTGVF